MKKASVFALVGIALTLAFFLARKMYTKFKDRMWYSHLVTITNSYNVPLDIIESQIVQESGGNEKASSSAGAKGLLQIKDIVLKEYNQNNKAQLKDLYDPFVNITVGVWYLNRLRTHYGFNNWKDSLLAYANGIGNVRNGIFPHPNYANEILTRAGYV